jgi:hypothetical protein
MLSSALPAGPANSRSLGFASVGMTKGRAVLSSALRAGPANRRSLHYAPPDFLWRLVALASFMRLSLRKGAHAALSGAVWQEIRYAPVGMTKLRAAFPGDG